MADFNDVFKLALRIIDLLDDFDDAAVGEEVEVPEIKAKIGKQRWRIPKHTATREK